MLFNLLLTFIAIFFFTFLMVSVQTKKQEESVQNDNNILITMRWQEDCDVDLWIQLPDGRRIWYSNRDEPPAHLDVDVTTWRKYNQQTGEYTIKDNEEVVTIRGVLEGEYTVNAHLYNTRNCRGPVETTIMVQDVRNRTVIYAGTKKVSVMEREVNFVKFTVDSAPLSTAKRQFRSSAPETQINGPQGEGSSHRGEYHIKDVYTDRPSYIVGNPKGSQGSEGGEFPGGEGGYPPQEQGGPPQGQEGIPPQPQEGPR